MSTVSHNSAWDHWYRRALPAYWIFLFSATHFPQLELDIPIRAPDKVAHWTAFGLLSFLFWRFAETLHRPVSSGFAWKAGLTLVAYAAVDEYLQQFVGRSTDLADWVCNAAGIVAVLAIMEWRRRVTRNTADVA